jgi:putative CGCGG family rSAM target protein
MSSSDDHAHDHDAEPVTDHVHDNSWSANLEKPQHADDERLVRQQAKDAVEHTEPGHHVNLVTHGDLGHPEEYLYEELNSGFSDRSIEWEYIEQCGCGGHVTRVHVE